MNWIIDGLLMFASSVFLYLFVRKSSLLKVPTQLNNLAMFLIPLFVYLFSALIQKSDLGLTTYQFLILAVVAVFFSYLGNVLSLKSIEIAPNPGYSLVISKSYVVFTTLVSVVIFNSDLTAKKAFAILLIVLFSALVMLNNKNQNNNYNKSWVWYSIGAFFCWGMLALASKYLLDIGVNVLERLIYSMIIVSGLIGLEMYKYKIKLAKVNPRQMWVLAAIGVSSAAFNYFMQRGYGSAPNPGYINAINASSISAVTIFSAILYKDELNWKKITGVAGVTLGLLLLII